MSEMVERVARAIAQADEQNGGPPYDWRIAQGKHAKEHLFDQARAAIEAMREPTIEMIEAGQMENNLLENPDPPNAFVFLSRAEIKGAWEAMLEAALSSSGEK